MFRGKSDAARSLGTNIQLPECIFERSMRSFTARLAPLVPRVRVPTFLFHLAPERLSQRFFQLRRNSWRFFQLPYKAAAVLQKLFLNRLP